MKKPVYSFGIIFKNEIRCLERCLQSLQPLRDAVPCEVVMADTGSTDGSREIAEKYADILFDFPWCDDFAAARNAVMDRCSGVWYFSIDADEWLAEDITELIAFSKEKRLPRDFGGVMIRNYKTAELEKGQNYVDFLAIRLARLSTGIRYQGCIHESWKSADGNSLQTMSLQETMLYHDGYAYENKAEEQQKRDRNMVLLKKKLAENPDDIQTLTECVDSTKHTDSGSIEYARRAIELVNEKRPFWDKLGSVVFRNAVSVAQLHHLPELGEWAEEGVKRFPESMFVRIDLAYYTFVHYFDEKNYAEAVRWGEMYQQGLADYHAGRISSSELSKGVLEFVSPFWERKVSVLMPQAYLELGEQEKALAGIRNVKGSELEDPQQVDLCVNMLVRLHRTTLLDAAEAMTAFWEQINEAFPDGKQALMRRAQCIRTAGDTFTRNYVREEEKHEDFLRHGYGVFAGLRSQCGLGIAAVMLETHDCQQLEQLLEGVENWNEFPISGLAHALERGVAFPLLGKPMNVEEMDALAKRLSRDRERFYPLACRILSNLQFQRGRELTWIRSVVLAAVQAYDWKDSEEDKEEGLSLAHDFAETERLYLPCCYAPQSLCEEGLYMLPPIHRFGWWCSQAFSALDAGDATGYVRNLRKGLESCETMSPMVEFLLEHTPKHTPELQVSAPSAEMLVLAEQIRTILAAYAPDDPAVAALRQSEAYQKVAYLIDGLEPPVMGGLLQ